MPTSASSSLSCLSDNGMVAVFGCRNTDCADDGCAVSSANSCNEICRILYIGGSLNKTVVTSEQIRTMVEVGGYCLRDGPLPQTTQHAMHQRL